jgi:hypothetical protein
MTCTERYYIETCRSKIAPESRLLHHILDNDVAAESIRICNSTLAVKEWMHIHNSRN